MKKICFFDLKNDGHHWNYNLNVIKSKISKENDCIYYTGKIRKEQKEILESLGVKIEVVSYYQFKSVFLIMNNFIILFKCILFCRKTMVEELYLLYLDPFIMQLGIVRFLYKKRIVGTLHWFPNNKLKEKMLKSLKKNIVVIVHTEEILRKMDGKAKLIYYPKFEEELVECKKIKNEKITLLYFGALRLDKGVDILLESLKYTTSDFNLIIAGKESTFSKAFVMDKIKSFNKERVIIDINYISDEKMKEYYDISDVVLLPYREHFLGESGILIDAITKGKVIISTKISTANQIIAEYKNGEIFDFEDEKMLALKIDTVVSNFGKYSKNAELIQKVFREKHNLNNFIEEYKII